MMRRRAVKAVIAALILCATPADARADEFTRLAAASSREIYLYAAALTAETCKALVAADARHVLVFLVTFKYDPARAEVLMRDFWVAALKSPEMAALKKRNQGGGP
jgi:hypothetical protein